MQFRTATRPILLGLLLSTALISASPCSLVGPARAQMQLPGAVAPTPEGSVVGPNAAPTASPKAAKRKPRPAGAGEASVAGRRAVAVSTPSVSALAGQTLYLNGRKSLITFVSHDKGVQVSRLLFSGGHAADAGEPCQVDLSANPPIEVADLGRPAGLSRIKLGLPACPIVFDILDGAALAVGDPPSCEFPENKCRVAPAGLWGPLAGTLGPKEVKTIERARAEAEGAVRTDFKLLLTTTKDKPTISGYAREQAGFSSVREEICRDYAGEGRHGLCATRLTQARAAALKAKFEVEAADKEQRRKTRAGR